MLFDSGVIHQTRSQYRMNLFNLSLALILAPALIHTAQAHEYKRFSLSAKCTVGADQQTYDKDKIALKSKEYSLVRYDVIDEESEEMASCQVDGQTDTPFKVYFKIESYSKSIKKAYKDKRSTPIHGVEFVPNMSGDTNSLKEILTQLGATNIPDMKDAVVEEITGSGYSDDLEFSKKKLKKNSWYNTKTLEYQVHFPKTEYAGISYHIRFSCSGSAASVTEVPCLNH